VSSVQYSDDRGFYNQVFSLLGRTRAPRRRRIESPQQVHEILESGLPSSARIALVENLRTIDRDTLLDVLDVSPRTFARSKIRPHALLSATESSNLWRLADLITQATRVFGDQEAAERWFLEPAIALDNRRPIELVKTAPGAQLVKELLTRVEYGVYT
jgi:putative toxin-antitoxin system antitoxin component (TIGR02293 family)